MAGASGILWAVLWFLLLIFIAWPVAFFCAGWYVFLSPFSACIEACVPLIELLERGMKLALTCAQNLVAQKEGC